MKKLTSILLVLILCFCITPVGAYNSSALYNEEYTFGYFKYFVLNNEALISGYTGIDTTVEIPETINGYSVTSILTDSFTFCYNLMKVIIPDSVVSVNAHSFSNCQNLKNIYVGTGVERFNAMAVVGCPNLVNISVDDNNRYYSSSNGILFNKSKTELVKFPDGLDTEYGIPNYVTKIGPYAFYSSLNLISVTIPKSVTEISDSAFSGCSNLQNISIGSGVTRIGEFAFAYCESITDILIPNETLELAKGAFAGCYSLKNITLGEELTTIGPMAFAYCSKIDDIKIPNKVKKIEPETFLLCSSLKSISIPESVVEIGQDISVGCSGLVSIEVAKENPDFSSIDGVLFNKSATELIIFPNSHSSSYTIPETVTAVSGYAFGDSVNLTSIIIPKSVVKIGEYAFYGCEGLLEAGYVGSDNEWNNITIKEGNDILLSLISCNYCNHNFELTKTVKPTYTAHGYKQYECENCGLYYKINLLKLKRTPIQNAKVSGIKNKAYTGRAITQSIKVTLKSKTLKKNTDYTVSYKNNKSTGKAKITIKGKGKYEGTITKTFIIYPKKATLKSVKSSTKKQMKVTWKKDKKASGYKIVYARNSKFTKSKKTITVKSYKTYKKTIKKLKSKKPIT